MNQNFNAAATRLHWNYFLALEKDLEKVSRYIEFSPDNLNTYSIELAHLLLSAASEVDTLAKCVCSILKPHAKPDNINEYRKIIKADEDKELPTVNFGGGTKFALVQVKDRHRLSDLKVYIPRYNVELAPWESWAKDKNPDWWHSYNKVKHERNQHFNKATLGNALNALAGLLVLNYAYCRFEITKTKPTFRYQHYKASVTRHMVPDSTFMRFRRDFYDDPFASLYAQSLGM